MTRGRAVLLAIVTALTVGWAPPSSPVAAATPDPPPASGAAAGPGAEPAPAPAPKPRIITLVGQTAFARPDEAMQLTFDLAGPPDGLEIQVLVHRAVTSRTEFTQAQNGRGLGGVEGRLSVPVPNLEQNSAGQRVLTVGVQGPTSATAPPDGTRIVPGRSGIYPTEVTVLRSSGVVDSFVTPLVVIDNGLSPLTLAWVWRFDATPAHQPDGTIRRAAGQAMGPSGRLLRLARAAAAAGGVPLTLAPTPETLAAWQEAARQEEHQPGGAPPDGASGGLTALKSAVTAPAHQVLRSPYVPIDMPGLLSANLAGEIDAEFARGVGDEQQILGTVAPTPATMLARGPLNNAALSRLRQYGAERLVLPPAALQPRDQRLTPGHPFAVGTRGKPYPAAISDPDLSRVLEGDDPPALRAARFLAALSLVALEAPGEPRGVVVVSPEEWDPPAALLDAVLSGLQNNPAVVPATLDGYFADVTPEGGDQPVVRDLASGKTSDPGDTDTIRSLRRQLAGFATVVEPTSPWLDTADRTILLSRATALQADNRAERKLSSSAGYLEGASRQLANNITSKVRGPKGQRVTLTSRRASIPISLLNATGRPLQVRVHLESDQLRFLDGAERFVTLAPQNTTERFRVESRTTGAFPLEITVTSPDGSLKINSSELTIRSTVVSGVGAVLTAGAGLFLLVWWGNDLRRSRHRRRGRARRQGRIAAKAAARALDDAERVAAKTG